MIPPIDIILSIITVALPAASLLTLIGLFALRNPAFHTFESKGKQWLFLLINTFITGGVLFLGFSLTGKGIASPAFVATLTFLYLAVTLALEQWTGGKVNLFQFVGIKPVWILQDLCLWGLIAAVFAMAPLVVALFILLVVALLGFVSHSALLRKGFLMMAGALLAFACLVVVPTVIHFSLPH